jgi:hypothetical protein
VYTNQICPHCIRSSNPAAALMQNQGYLQVSPSTVAYHVQVSYAEDEEVIEKTSQCDLLEEDGTELEELPVIQAGGSKTEYAATDNEMARGTFHILPAG